MPLLQPAFSRFLVASLLVACNGDDKGGDSGDLTLPAPLLVPAPVSLERDEGSFVLDEGTRVVAPGEAAEVGALLALALRPGTGLPIEVVDEGGAGDLVLDLDPSLDLPAEGYRLEVEADGVVVSASAAAGLFYGTQTLRQLLPPATLSDEPVEDLDLRIPALRVEDEPRFAERGLMIDVARHFFSVEDVERQIDLLAQHKLNRLHLHLTDDQGWRLEIKSWPDLTAIGGSTEVGGGEGGYYTQEEYQALVAYAAARFVTVVPEIDFPGHAHAALASYGALNESGEPEDLYTYPGVISTPLWLEGEITWTFVEDVWREVASITPGEEVHIGGDEAIDISAEEYAEFISWLQEVLAEHGKTITGWDEIGDVDLVAPFRAQHWWHEDQALAAVAQGGRLIASPAEHTYLDMEPDDYATYGQTWAGRINVEKAYDWDPVPSGATEEDVAGVEAALWTEYINSVTKLDQMIWPRLAATAEVAWSPQAAREWEDFAERVAWHGARLEAQGVRYYRTHNEVEWVELEEAGE